MEDHEVNYLYENGCTIITMNLPIGSEFGIDCSCPWRIEDDGNICGIKMIPPGIHILFWNSSDFKEKRISSRTSTFVNLIGGEILIYNWSTFEERPILSTSDKDKCINKRSIDNRLVAYPYDTYRRWISLTSEININVISKLLPTCGFMTSGSDLLPECSSTSDRLNRPLLSGMPNMTPRPGTLIKWSIIEEKCRPPKSCPKGDITKLCLDRSWQLNSILLELSETELLGEFQASFICILIGQIYESLSVWRAFITLLSSCSDETINVHNSLYERFLSIVFWQLKELPNELKYDNLDGILSSHLGQLLSQITLIVDNSLLKQKALKFSKYLKKEYGNNWDSEPSDWAPTIFDNTENSY